MLADGQTIVCFGSSATSPAMPYYLVPGDGPGGLPYVRKMIAASALPKDFPSDQLVEPQTVAIAKGALQVTQLCLLHSQN